MCPDSPTLLPVINLTNVDSVLVSIVCIAVNWNSPVQFQALSASNVVAVYQSEHGSISTN